MDDATFYWVANGFRLTAPESTGVSRESLIEVLKDIDADLTIIVQDACFSGQGLLKSEQVLRPLPLARLVGFSSSPGHEPTPAGVELSPFTDNFIEAASFARDAGVVDYLDIARKLKDVTRHGRIRPTLDHQGCPDAVFCEDATTLDTIREKYRIEEVACEQEDVPAPVVLSDQDVLRRAEETMLTNAQLQTAIDACATAARNTIGADEKVAACFETTEALEGDYYKATNKAQLVALYRRLAKWDAYVIAKHERVPKRRTMFDRALLNMYEPEFDDVYDFHLSVSLDHVYQRYYLTPTYQVLRRRMMELLVIPGVFDVHLLWRLNAQPLSDEGAFSDDLQDEDWAVETLSLADPKLQIEQIAQRFCQDAAAAVSRTTENLRQQLK